MIDVEEGRLREPAALAMIASAAVVVLVRTGRLLVGLTPGLTFSERAAATLDDLSSPMLAALALGAVLLVTRFGEIPPRGREITLGAVGTMGVALLFGLVSLGGLLVAGFGLRTTLEGLLIALPQMGLMVIALLYTMRVYNTTPWPGAARRASGTVPGPGAPYPGQPLPGQPLPGHPQGGHPQPGPGGPGAEPHGVPGSVGAHGHPAGPNGPGGPNGPNGPAGPAGHAGPGEPGHVVPRPALEPGPSTRSPEEPGQDRPAHEWSSSERPSPEPAHGLPRERQAAMADHAAPEYGGDPGTVQQEPPRQARHGMARTESRPDAGDALGADDPTRTRDVPRPPAPAYSPPRSEDYAQPTAVYGPSERGDHLSAGRYDPPGGGHDLLGEGRRDGANAAGHGEQAFTGSTGDAHGSSGSGQDGRHSPASSGMSGSAYRGCESGEYTPTETYPSLPPSPIPAIGEPYEPPRPLDGGQGRHGSSQPGEQGQPGAYSSTAAHPPRQERPYDGPGGERGYDMPVFGRQDDRGWPTAPYEPSQQAAPQPPQGPPALPSRSSPPPPPVESGAGASEAPPSIQPYGDLGDPRQQQILQAYQQAQSYQQNQNRTPGDGREPVVQPSGGPAQGHFGPDQGRLDQHRSDQPGQDRGRSGHGEHGQDHLAHGPAGNDRFDHGAPGRPSHHGQEQQTHGSEYSPRPQQSPVSGLSDPLSPSYVTGPQQSPAAGLPDSSASSYSTGPQQSPVSGLSDPLSPSYTTGPQQPPAVGLSDPSAPSYMTGPQRSPLDDPLDTSKPLPEYTSYSSGPQPSPSYSTGPQPSPLDDPLGPRPALPDHPSGPQPQPIPPSPSEPWSEDRQRHGGIPQGYGSPLGHPQAPPYRGSEPGAVHGHVAGQGREERLGADKTQTFHAGDFPGQNSHQGDQNSTAHPHERRNRDEPIDPTAIYAPDQPPPR